MRHLTGFEWLNKWVTELEVTNSKHQEIISQVIKIEPNIFNEFSKLTPLKLIIFNYCLNVCSTIIRKTDFFKNKYYVDLFAGSGLNKMKDNDDFIIGSPLIAALNHSECYSSMIFCENNNGYSNALDLRLDLLGINNLQLMKEDYEACLDNIIDKVTGRDTYSFFFIDPYSTEFSWDSMKRVLAVRSDIVLTFMTGQIFRIVGLAKSKRGGEDILKKLFGDESWKAAQNADDLVSIYRQNIFQERKGAPVKTIKIKSKKHNFVYHLFFITNKTKNDNTWLRFISKVKKEIESNSDVAVTKSLDIVKNRQSQLSKF